MRDVSLLKSQGTFINSPYFAPSLSLQQMIAFLLEEVSELGKAFFWTFIDSLQEE